jgi:hypothetical protein
MTERVSAHRSARGEVCDRADNHHASRQCWPPPPRQPGARQDVAVDPCKEGDSRLEPGLPARSVTAHGAHHRPGRRQPLHPRLTSQPRRRGRWADVDLTEGIVHVRRALERRDREFVFKDTKSRTSRRSIPLPGVCAEADDPETQARALCRSIDSALERPERAQLD